MRPHQLTRGAEMVQPALHKLIARLGVIQRVDRHWLTQSQRRIVLLRFGAQRRNFAGKFVAHHQRRHAQRVVAQIAAQL